MEVRRRLPRERSYLHERRADVAPIDTTTASSGHGAFNSVWALFVYLIGCLKSMVYASPKDDGRQKEDAEEDKSEEESVLLGHMGRGLIAVYERRRKTSRALVLSSSDATKETPSALKHAAAAYAFLGSQTHPRLLR